MGPQPLHLVHQVGPAIQLGQYVHPPETGGHARLHHRVPGGRRPHREVKDLLAESRGRAHPVIGERIGPPQLPEPGRGQRVPPQCGVRPGRPVRRLGGPAAVGMEPAVLLVDVGGRAIVPLEVGEPSEPHQGEAGLVRRGHGVGGPPVVETGLVDRQVVVLQIRQQVKPAGDGVLPRESLGQADERPLAVLATPLAVLGPGRPVQRLGGGPGRHGVPREGQQLPLRVPEATRVVARPAELESGPRSLGLAAVVAGQVALERLDGPTRVPVPAIDRSDRPPVLRRRPQLGEGAGGGHRGRRGAALHGAAERLPGPNRVSGLEPEPAQLHPRLRPIARRRE